MATLKFEFTVPDAKKVGIVEDFAMAMGYNEILESEGVTKAQFAKQALRDLIRSKVRRQRKLEAQQNVEFDFDDSYVE